MNKGTKSALLPSHLADRKIYLGSKSPRRKELMTLLGLDFEVLSFDVDETFPEEIESREMAKYLAEKKLNAIPFSDYEADAIFITCDTIVVCDGIVLGKPANYEETYKMLSLLSGKTHYVSSAIAMYSKGKKIIDQSTTYVTFKDLSKEEIDYYYNRCNPTDKAGAYGIQEWIGLVGVTGIKGSYFNVVGMPTDLLWKMLGEI